MARSKNVLSVLMQSFVVCGLITIQWVLFGYSLAFGPDHFHLIGDLSWAGLNHVDVFKAAPVSSGYAQTIPHMAFCMFQLMFAIITPALISGAVIERMKFPAYLIFIVIWATIVYDPLVHWVWGHGGWLNRANIMDFAGGTVVEMASGFSALTLAFFVGKRKKPDSGEDLAPHNLPLTMIGVGLLWFGWFGFNAGSALTVATASGTAGSSAVLAFVNTQIGASTASLAWLALDWILYKKPTALGFGSGAVAGMVAITPACGFVSPLGALLVGTVAGVVCFFAIKFKHQIGADDTLDVFGVHGCGGIWGTLATGLLAVGAYNVAGTNGLFYGGSFVHAMLPQLLGFGGTFLITVIGTSVAAGITYVICGGLRSSADDEEAGLDLADHGETGYSGNSAGAPPLLGAN
jgi:Amt family ammonium transporter